MFGLFESLPCGVWCRGLIAVYLCLGQSFGNLVLNESCIVCLALKSAFWLLWTWYKCLYCVVVNSLTLGRRCNFRTRCTEWFLQPFIWNCLQLNDNGPHGWEINIGSGNGLVASDNKPFPEPKFDPDLCRHMASLGHNEFNTDIFYACIYAYFSGTGAIGSSDNGSNRYWPPGSQHTPDAGDHTNKGIGLFCGLKFFALNIFCEEYL